MTHPDPAWHALLWDGTTARPEQPLEALAAHDVAALVFRQALPADRCAGIVRQLIEEGLLFDPELPVPEKFRRAAIPEGYYREGVKPAAATAVHTPPDKTRIDVGTSLGYRGSDKEAFLEHSRQTHELFQRLWGGDPHDPVRVLYDRLQRLAGSRRVTTARESDGRLYGPAIVRAHYGGYAYRPHFDSVRLREKREEYAVHDFEHQFAGVLLLQNTQLGGRQAQCRLHRYLWRPEIDPHLAAGTFHDYARDNRIESQKVALEPGDLYFFNTRGIHEVPGVAGRLPRIVLATFIGYDARRDEVFVWS